MDKITCLYKMKKHEAHILEWRLTETNFTALMKLSRIIDSVYELIKVNNLMTNILIEVLHIPS